MADIKPVTFGKKGVALARPQNLGPAQRTRWMVWGLAAASVVAVVAGVLSISAASPNPNVHQAAAEVQVTPAPFPLNGTWAANGQSCAEAKHKLELDGTMMTSISMLGRVPIGPYTTAGDNPVVFTFDGGEKVVWDVINENRLEPISITPEKAGRREMMTLTRC